MNHTNCQFRDKHTVGGIVFYKHAFLVMLSIAVQTEPGDDPEVVRAKYFIRDEFLVGYHCSSWDSLVKTHFMWNCLHIFEGEHGGLV